MSGDFQIGEWSVQPAVNRLKRGEQVTRLEPKVMQVLVRLAEDAGEVVTREQLIASVWPDVFVTDDVLHRAIRELRRALGDSTSAPRYIETIRKRGYRLIPPSAAVESEGSEIAGTAPGTVRAPRRPGNEPVERDRPAEPAAPPLHAAALAVALAGAVVVAVFALASRDDMSPQAHARFVPVVSGPLNESDPAVSPDGRQVAFVQRAAGATASADIYVHNLDSGRVDRITADPASDRMPAWSPDGARLAFVRTTTAGCDIVVRELAAASETRLGACANAADPKLTWTADGRALLTSHAPDRHVESGWRLARIDAVSGAVSILTDPPQGIVGDHGPAVSPNGRHIAFIRRASGGVSDIFVAEADGSRARRVTFDESDLTGIDWTGDGRSIVYSSDRAGGYSLWRVGLEGGTPSLIAGGAARMKHPAADRAARRVVYENWNYEINVWELERVRLGGQGGHAEGTRTGPAGPSAATPVTRTSELWNIYPQVSPDGSQLAYVTTQSGSHQLWVAARDGSDARQLTHVPGGFVKSPRWSPDGRHVVYLARGRGGRGTQDPEALDATGARGSGGIDVQYVDVTTGAIAVVTDTPANEVAPSWSHDGKRILFGAPDAQGRWHVWSVDAANTRDVRLEIADAVAAHAATDGSALFFTRPHQPGIWKVSASSPPERVVDKVAAGNTLGWMVNADAIYFLDERDDSVRVRRAPVGGGPSTEVATLTQLSWPGFSVAPDGAILYARWDRRDSNLMSIEY